MFLKFIYQIEKFIKNKIEEQTGKHEFEYS